MGAVSDAVAAASAAAAGEFRQRRPRRSGVHATSAASAQLVHTGFAPVVDRIDYIIMVPRSTCRCWHWSWASSGAS